MHGCGSLNPVNKMKLKLGLENDCTVVAVPNPMTERKLKVGLENDCTVVKRSIPQMKVGWS